MTEELFKEITDAVMALATVILALYTARLASATIRLANETQKLVRETQDGARATERAYILAECEVLDELPCAGSKLPKNSLWIKWKNFGRSPALAFQISLYLQVSREAPKSIRKAHDKNQLFATHAIASGDSLTWQITNDIDDLKLTKLAVSDDGDHLYVVGEMLYKDIFGLERQTSFCSQIIMLPIYTDPKPKYNAELGVMIPDEMTCNSIEYGLSAPDINNPLNRTT